MRRQKPGHQTTYVARCVACGWRGERALRDDGEFRPCRCGGRLVKAVTVQARIADRIWREMQGHDRVFDSLREMQATADDERRPRAANRLAKRKGKEE